MRHVDWGLSDLPLPPHPMLERLVLVTDLDGTLLDPHDYRWAPARSALEALDALGVDVVFASSKTSAEIEALMEEMDREGPWIAENGAVLGKRPDDGPWRVDRAGETGRTASVRGPSYRELREILDELRRARGWRFSGFGDWTPDEIARRTGLGVAEAERAARRDATEPLLWEERDGSSALLREELEDRGLRLVAGGRFLTAGPDVDKADGARELLRRNADRWPEPILAAAGDSPNDRALLAAADWAIVVPRPDGASLEVEGRRGTLRASEPGPTGWNAAVLDLVDRLRSDSRETDGGPHG